MIAISFAVALPWKTGSDPPDWDIWKRQFLILRECVRWFVNHCDEDPIQEPINA